MKYQQVVSLLEKRIMHGDYNLKEIPSERVLAQEVNVSHMTARKAVQELVDRGLLVRQANRRLMVNRETMMSGEVLQIGLLFPAFPSPYMEQWRQWITQLTSERGGSTRLIGYTHWDDATIEDAINGFDGIFFMPMGQDLPDRLVKQFQQSNASIVVLGQDCSRYGLPSLRLTSPEMVRDLLDHVGSLGHDVVDCVNYQPVEEAVEHRIEQWQFWITANNKRGTLINEPVVAYQSSRRIAYESFKARLNVGPYDASAIFCVTSAAAMGIMRAFHEAGYVIGRDISICSAEDGADTSPFLIPSLTCLQDTDPRPYLAVCLDWMADAQQHWVGPLLVQPTRGILFVGETVGTCHEAK